MVLHIQSSHKKKHSMSCSPWKPPKTKQFLHIGSGMMNRLEEDVFVLYQWLYHLPLVADVVQCCHGVEVWCAHQSGPKHDPQILCVHQVVLLILGHPINTKIRCVRIPSWHDYKSVESHMTAWFLTFLSDPSDTAKFHSEQEAAASGLHEVPQDARLGLSALRPQTNTSSITHSYCKQVNRSIQTVRILNKPSMTQIVLNKCLNSEADSETCWLFKLYIMFWSLWFSTL